MQNLCCLSVVKDFVTFKKYNLHVVMEPDKDSNTASAQTKDENGTAMIARRDSHDRGDEKTSMVAKGLQDGDITAKVMFDGAKSGDVEDSANVEDSARSGDVEDSAKSGDVEYSAKSGDVEDSAKSGDVGEHVGAVISGEVTPAPAAQLQQAPCEEGCEHQQSSSCGNTEP